MNKKNILKYILLFFYYFICLNFVYFALRMDSYNNYGFSYGIVTGGVPYKELNMIVPLFGPILYSTLLIIHKSVLVYYFEQAILLTIFSYLLFKILDKKAWITITIFFLPIIVPFAYCLYPGYNFLILFELVLLLYLIDKNKSDKLIGLIAGISIITKQNIGIFIFIVTLLFVIKNKKKLFNRLLYGIIPIGILFIIILLYGNLYEFIDLCFLGMGDFIGNSNVNITCLVITIILMIIITIKFIKDKNKNISYYYLLVYLLVVIPLFDLYHFSLFVYFYVIVFLYNSKINIDKKMLPYVSFVLINVFICIWVVLSWDHFKEYRLYSYKNYEMVFLTKEENKTFKSINKYVKDKRFKVIGTPSDIIFMIATNNKKSDTYTVYYRGNFCKDGVNNALKDIKNSKDTYFIVDANKDKYIREDNQFLKEVPEYIIKNYKFVKRIGNYNIYYRR